MNRAVLFLDLSLVDALSLQFGVKGKRSKYILVVTKRELKNVGGRQDWLEKTIQRNVWN